MLKNTFRTIALFVCFAILSMAGLPAHAGRGPSRAEQCARDTFIKYNNSKYAARACLDQLEEDIEEGIATGLPLSPPVIQSRTAQCNSMEMTTTQFATALRACARLR